MEELFEDNPPIDETRFMMMPIEQYNNFFNLVLDHKECLDILGQCKKYVDYFANVKMDGSDQAKNLLARINDILIRENNK